MSGNLPQTIGIDISKAALDRHAHPPGIDRQFPNTAEGHKALTAWAKQWQIERIAYEATGTYPRALEVALADLPCVKLNPERARRFAQATGTLAKTDRIDARMAIALQPPVRPARSPQQNQLAELINARDGLVRDRPASKNRDKYLTVALLKRQCSQRLEQIARHIATLDAEIASVIAADEKLARRHDILVSIAGLGILTANQIIATMPELGSLDNKQAASLAGLAPVAPVRPVEGQKLHPWWPGQRPSGSLHACSRRRPLRPGSQGKVPVARRRRKTRQDRHHHRHAKTHRHRKRSAQG